MTLRNLLETWEIPLEIIENFMKNGLETTHLKDLSDEILKELCPMICTRINLKNKINEYITAQTKTISVDSGPSCSSLNIEDISGLDSELEDCLLDMIHIRPVAWLKVNTEPWDAVINKWNSTYELREMMKYETVESFIKNWPILNDVRSDILINLDFDKQHPNRATKFHVLWKEFIEKITDLKTAKSKEDAASMLEYIDNLTDDDHKLPRQIKLLCILVPPKGRLNKREKFSTTECMETFIVDVENTGDIDQKIEDISTKALKQKRTVQPYIIHCITEKGTGGTFYVIIDKVRYIYKSAFKAFDTLFKCYHI